MKKILLGLCIFIFSASLAQSRYLSFNDGYVSQRNFNTPQRTITNGDSYIDVEYKFDGAYIKQTSIDSINAYLQIYMDNAYYIAGSMAIKRPIHEHLPYYKDLIALTEDANANTIKLEIIDEKYQDYSCPLYKVNKSEVANENIFVSIPNDESKSFFPKDIVLNATKGTFRTVPVTSVNVYPVVYESSSKTLRCYSYIKYRINFNKLDKPAQLSKLALDMLGRATSNPEMLKKYDNNMLKSEDSSKTCDYLIVTKDDYKVAAEKIASWKSRLGYKCQILSEPEWKANYPDYVADTIKKFCSEFRYMPDYLLIIGSNKDIPAHKPQAPNTYSSDAQSARLNSNTYDDMIKGRICAHSAKEAISIVDKIISYESAPPVDSDFYEDILSISYFQTENSPYNRESISFDFVSSAEGANYDLEKMGYNINRHFISQDDSKPQYFANGEKMPDEMYMEDASGNAFWDKEPSDINEMINNGKAMVIYRGHGNETAYCGNAYTQKDVAKLENGNKTPVFFNFTCATGSFDIKDSICFAECLLNKENGGAVGVFANSFPTIHGESNIMVAGTFEALFNNQDISIAGAILEATFKTELEETREIGHYFGDPSMRLYTVEPATFKPFINRGNDNSITVDSHVKGSKITVCSIADYGKSYFKTFDASNETKFVFENVNVPCYITITKANYVPYVTVSKTDLYLQNMTLTGYHDIVANNIISGEKVTDQMKEGAFIVESGTTKLRSSKTLSLKSGTSVKYGASLRARKGDLSNYAYKGDGKPRTADIPLCFNSLANRFIPNDLYNYENNNGSLSSVSDNESNSFSIYPNPTSGRINVAVNNGNNINEVVVLDITGNVLMSESVNANNISLDLSSFAKGLYLVKVVTAEDSFVKKVVLK